MIGLFSIFGRADSLKALDQALRAFGMHPRTVPEAVKLATVKILQNETDAKAKPPEAAYTSAAELLGYCILGRDQFIASNTLEEAERAEVRLEAAIAAGDGPDASLILLALHSGVISPGIADRFYVETD